jgi:phage-related tail protein
MGPDTLTIANGVAVLVLAISGIALCSTITIFLIKLYPSVRSIASNLDKTTGSSAVTAENAAVIFTAFAAKADEMAENLATAAEKSRETMESTAETTSNLAAASALLGPAGAVASAAKSVKTGLADLMTDEQRQETISQVKEKLHSQDVAGFVERVTGRVGNFFHIRRG